MSVLCLMWRTWVGVKKFRLEWSRCPYWSILYKSVFLHSLYPFIHHRTASYIINRFIPFWLLGWGLFLEAKCDNWLDTKCYSKNPSKQLLFQSQQQKYQKNVWNMSKVNKKKRQKDVINIALVFLLLTLNLFHTFFLSFYFWLWTSNCLLA